MAQSRYALLLSEPTVQVLDRIQAAYGLSTRAAVFDFSVVVLDWLDRQIAAGYDVGRSKDGDFQQLLLPYARKTVEANAQSGLTRRAGDVATANEASSAKASRDEAAMTDG